MLLTLILQLAIVYGLVLEHSLDGTSFRRRAEIVGTQLKGNQWPTKLTGYRYYLKLNLGESRSLIKSVPADLLRQCPDYRINEEIVIWKDKEGQVVDFSYSINPYTCEQAQETLIVYKQSEDGPNPILVSRVKEEEKNLASQSFFVKYWYLILPAILAFLIVSPEEETKK